MYRLQSLTPLPRMPPACRECGCTCSLCDNNSLDWHHKIEELKAKLIDVTARTAMAENQLTESRYKADQENARLQEELCKQRDRYDRLMESHKKLQKLNNELEDKLITVVSKLEAEKMELTETLGSLQHKLTDIETLIVELEEERDRLKSDCTLAVQLLHCKPSDFIAYKLSELPLSLQERVRGQLTREEILELEEDDMSVNESLKSVRVPIPTFPPTAVYALREPVPAEDSNPLRRINTVPMSLVARALLPADDSELSSHRRHVKGDIYICALCRRSDVVVNGDCGSNNSNTAHVNATINNSMPSCHSSPGIHRARRSPTQPSLTLTRS